MAQETGGRYPEIDLARGVAILMMVTYHFLFDLDYLGVAQIPVTSGFLLAFARATASLFIAISGISSAISYSRTRFGVPPRNQLTSGRRPLGRVPRGAPAGKFAKRGLKLFAWGMVITAVTYPVVGKEAVCFGILHFIGISVALAPFFIPLGVLNFAVGPLLIWSGLQVSGVDAGFPWLFWLGLKTAEFNSLDYFPLLPWFGVFLIGIGIGTVLYSTPAMEPISSPARLSPLSSVDISDSEAEPPGDLSTLELSRGSRPPASRLDRAGQPFVRFLAFLGKRSLLIYLLHQPVLLGLVYVAKLISTSK